MDGDKSLGVPVDSADLPDAVQKPDASHPPATQADLAAVVVALKAWVRREIEMKATGLTDAERKALNG